VVRPAPAKAGVAIRIIAIGRAVDGGHPVQAVNTVAAIEPRTGWRTGEAVYRVIALGAGGHLTRRIAGEAGGIVGGRRTDKALGETGEPAHAVIAKACPCTIAAPETRGATQIVIGYGRQRCAGLVKHGFWRTGRVVGIVHKHPVRPGQPGSPAGKVIAVAECPPHHRVGHHTTQRVVGPDDGLRRRCCGTAQSLRQQLAQSVIRVVHILAGRAGQVLHRHPGKQIVTERNAGTIAPPHGAHSAKTVIHRLLIVAAVADRAIAGGGILQLGEPVKTIIDICGFIAFAVAQHGELAIARVAQALHVALLARNPQCRDDAGYLIGHIIVAHRDAVRPERALWLNSSLDFYNTRCYRLMRLVETALRIFKTKAFARFCRHEDIDDSQLREVIAAAEAGKIDAVLGRDVIKQRLARPGAGKSGGYRTIILFRRNECSVFVYGFAKSDRENLSSAELAAFRKAARQVLGFDEKIIAALLKTGDWSEV
jgi:hypothetical protein